MLSGGENAPTDWITYWDQQKLFRDRLWQLHAQHFVQASNALMQYAPADRLLDIGCGSGYIAAALAPKISELWGLDTSPRFVAECRARLQAQPNASFEVLPSDNYFDFSQAPHQYFNKIVCVGVVPLYAHVSDVGRLIEGVREMIVPGAKMIVTDFILNGSVLKDTWGSIAGGIKHRCLGEKLRLVWGAGTSGYLSQRKYEKLLSFNGDELKHAVSGYGVEGKLIKGHMTLNTQRRHIFYQF
jgi:2-polyprenyl-3-methyl-5-hydroxy-6-metoxy-1,4-benzoquinol methylase